MDLRLVRVSSMWGLWSSTNARHHKNRSTIRVMVLPKVLEQDTGENEADTSAMHWLRRKERCFGTASATFLGGLGRRAVLFERQSRLPSVALQRMLA